MWAGGRTQSIGDFINLGHARMQHGTCLLYLLSHARRIWGRLILIIREFSSPVTVSSIFIIICYY